jgi:hypothetical protein
MEKLGRAGHLEALESPRPIHDFAVMFDHFDNLPIVRKSTTFMDRDIQLFQGDVLPASIPPRRPAAMPAQPVVPWTFARLAVAGLDWLMAETAPTLPAPISTTNKRRV